jgi:hypothetical protein
MNTAWVAIANILATYNLEKATDTEGSIIEPKIEFKGGLVSHPEPYKIRYVPRFDEVENLITTTELTAA